MRYAFDSSTIWLVVCRLFVIGGDLGLPRNIRSWIALTEFVKGSIIIDKVSTLNKITLKLKDGMEKDITVERLEEDMFYEIEEFIKCFKRKSIESEKNPHSNSIKAIEVLDEYRKNIGLKFENE